MTVIEMGEITKYAYGERMTLRLIFWSILSYIGDDYLPMKQMNDPWKMQAEEMRAPY